MMSNLFSVFDPTSSFFSAPLNWSSSIIFILFFPLQYWLTPNRWGSLWNTITLALFKEFAPILTYSSLAMLLFSISLFMMIMFNNVMGLSPYIFTSSSHMAMTLSLALPIWASYMILGWIKSTKHMFTHLVPQGTPFALMPFMVLIETISNAIRPVTLTIRLAANMIAGHLLLTLLGNACQFSSAKILWLIILIQMLLLLLEIAVAFIQSYVFSILTVLYASEIK